MKFVAIGSLVVFGCGACSPAPVDRADAPALPASIAPAVSVQAVPASDPYARDVRIILSPAALARLAEMNERVVVSAFWSGAPKPGSSVRLNDDYSVTVGQERVILPATGGVARLTAANVDHALEPELEEGEAWLNINVFSARERGPDNILHCDSYDAPGSQAANPIQIDCKLIEE